MIHPTPPHASAAAAAAAVQTAILPSSGGSLQSTVAPAIASSSSAAAAACSSFHAAPASSRLSPVRVLDLGAELSDREWESDELPPYSERMIPSPSPRTATVAKIRFQPVQAVTLPFSWGSSQSAVTSSISSSSSAAAAAALSPLVLTPSQRELLRAPPSPAPLDVDRNTSDSDSALDDLSSGSDSEKIKEPARPRLQPRAAGRHANLPDDEW